MPLRRESTLRASFLMKPETYLNSGSKLSADADRKLVSYVPFRMKSRLDYRGIY